MRIWSLHPKYLDSKGLVALWRETLLAKNVLLGKTKGYRNHPQLIRFREAPDPVKNINYYLEIVWSESQKRNFNFDPKKFNIENKIRKIEVNKGQVEFEFVHLLNKLKVRDLARYQLYKDLKDIELHSLFNMKDGAMEYWEKGIIL